MLTSARILIIVFLSVVCALGQAATPDVAGGLQPYQSYQGGDLDKVNLQNGNLTVRLPLVSYPQRGSTLKLDFSLIWNGKPYVNEQFCTPNMPGVPSQDHKCWYGWIQNGVFDSDAEPPVSGWSVVDEQNVFPSGYTYTFEIDGCRSGGSLNCQAYAEDIATWETSDGSTHVSMPISPSSTTTSSTGSPLPLGITGQVALDGTGFFTGYGQDSTTNPNWPVPCTAQCYSIGPDGVVYYPGGYMASLNSTYVARQDADGNQISLQLSGTPGVASYIDTVGRSIPSKPTAYTVSQQNPLPAACNDPTSPYNTSINEYGLWQVPGANGSTLTYTFCYAPIPINIPPLLSSPDSYGRTNPTEELVRVALPNGLAWSFQYSSQDQFNTTCTYNGTACNYGDLSRVGFPTGGSISYLYGLSRYSYGASGSIAATPASSSMSVVSRSVNANDGAGSHQWTYSWPSTNGIHGTTFVESAAGFVVNVTDPYGNQTAHTFGSPGDFAGNGSSMYETLTQFYSGSASGTPLKSVATTYQDQQDEFVYAEGVQNVLPIQTVTTLDNGKSSTMKTTYCCSIGINGSGTGGTGGIWLNAKSDIKTYDYVTGGGLGSLLQDKKTSYQFQNTAAYLTANMLTLPANRQILDGNGNTFSETTYCYDEGTPTSGSTCAGNGNAQSSGITTQHIAPVQPVRGHLTSTINWLSGSTSPTTYASSHSIWYDTGEVSKSIDGDSNATTFAYSSTYAGSLPTSVTNALSQQATTVYDGTLGLKTSVTDANSNTSSFVYDNYGRLKQVNYPDKYQSTYGQTNYSYNDSATAPSFTASLVSAMNSPDTEEIDLDGLGREIRTKMLSDPGGVVESDTTYDGVGRKWKVSNPYRSTSDGTYGLTVYGYDALSRPSSVTRPDGTSIVNYSYTGAASKVSDEGNGQHSLSTVSQKDALGRVTYVCEVWSSTYSPALQGSSGDTTATSCGQYQDIATTGFLTSYTYDPLGNLTYVSQGSLPQRHFIYDWKSRLTSANNPESGVTTYTYDGNSNVHTRIRPAPNQGASGTVTATSTYTYDALNRITGVTYADSLNTATPTPSVGYSYDTAFTGVSLPSQANLVGRLSADYTVNSSGAFVAARAFSYDPAGRETMLAECTIDDCPSKWYYEMMYGYDVTGNPLSMQMITAAGDTSSFTLSYTYNTVNQLSGIMSNLVSTPNYPATLFSLGASGGYGPLGGLASATLGNGAVETYFYDQRNRLGCETVKYNSTTLYSVELSPANGQCSGNTFSNGSGIGYSGNSDVVEAFDSVNGHWTYGYDDFNRLVSAAATSGPESGKSMAWSYDRFGNRWSQSLTGQTPQSYSFDSGNHRMTQYINNYDAAGNLMLDPMSNLVYTYDDENRVIAVGTEEYVYDKDGHQVGEMQPNGTFNRAEIYAGNRHLATYDYTPQQTIFIHNDWQGTERVRSKYDGTSYQTCTNLPFGDSQNCTVSGGANDPSPLHYTGKMRDVETNLDYFGARYYSSGMGHWMSPDWAAKPTSVPYANFGDPQSLDLYAFVSNNPVIHQDSDGHLMTLAEEQASWGGDGGFQGYSIVGGTDATYAAGWLKTNNEIAPGQNTNAPLTENTKWYMNQSGNYQSKPDSAMFAHIWSLANQQWNIDASVIAAQVSQAASDHPFTQSDVLNETAIARGPDGLPLVIGGHVALDVKGQALQDALKVALGGNYNDGKGNEFARLGGLSGSTHLDDGHLHVDRANASASYGAGLALHFGHDVFWGSEVYGNVPMLPY